MYPSNDRLIILDADGTTIDSFAAIERAFVRHGMSIGDLERFQQRRNLFKYLGGIKEFPRNLARQMRKVRRSDLLLSLTEVYREEASLFPGMAGFIRSLIKTDGLRVGLVTRNITHEPEVTLGRLFARHDLDIHELDFIRCILLKEKKGPHFQEIVREYRVNPARAYACGDEHGDYNAALSAGIRPFIGSYGFESHKRLSVKFEIPEGFLSSRPEELIQRVIHALDIEGPR